MFKRAGMLVLPLIVLAGMRRCPRVPRFEEVSAVGMPLGVILVGMVALVAMGAVFNARYGKKA